MIRSIFLSFALAIFLALPQAARAADLPQCPSLMRSLARGDRGGDVARLQQFLHELGYLGRWTPGRFGPRTDAAVRRWQEERGIARAGDPACGIFGAQSIALLQEQCDAWHPPRGIFTLNRFFKGVWWSMPAI